MEELTYTQNGRMADEINGVGGVFYSETTLGLLFFLKLKEIKFEAWIKIGL